MQNDTTASQPRTPGRGNRLRWLCLLFCLIPLALAATERPVFSGERALQHIHTQVGFGPRLPGSEAHRQTRDHLVVVLAQLADKVALQQVTYQDPDDPSHILFGWNIVANFRPDLAARVMLAAHWDTRAVADQDPDPARRTRPVPGANDGASGVAVLLEMAHLLAASPPDTGVDIVLFDLEDQGGVVGDMAYAYGSRRFVAENPDYRPRYGILLDMVCDRYLRIPQEAYSRNWAGAVVERIWRAADRVGAAAFLDEQGPAVIDDHLPFLEQGIPVVDLIHTPFPSYWHTTADTPERCRADSLQQVGDVLVEMLYGE